MYCPLGLWMAPPAPTAWKPDQLASGLAVLPVRVSNDVPVLAPVRLPHTVWALSADRTREVKVPDDGAAPMVSQSLVTAGPPSAMWLRSLTIGRIGPAIGAACVATRAPSMKNFTS